MTDYTIAQGESQKVITRQEADEIKRQDSDVNAFVIDVQGGDARLVDKEYNDAQAAAQAVPVLEGQALYGFDPQGREWYMYNDAASGTITVNVTPQRFTLSDSKGV